MSISLVNNYRNTKTERLTLNPIDFSSNTLIAIQISVIQNKILVTYSQAFQT